MTFDNFQISEKSPLERIVRSDSETDCFEHRFEAAKIFKVPTIRYRATTIREIESVFTQSTKLAQLPGVCASPDRQIVRLVARAIGGNDFVFVARYSNSLERSSLPRRGQLIFPRTLRRVVAIVNCPFGR